MCAEFHVWMNLQIMLGKITVSGAERRLHWDSSCKSTLFVLYFGRQSCCVCHENKRAPLSKQLIHPDLHTVIFITVALDTKCFPLMQAQAMQKGERERGEGERGEGGGAKGGDREPGH